MIFFRFFILFFLASASSVYGQTEKMRIDSLLKEGTKYENVKPQTALKYYREAHSITKNINDSIYMGKVLSKLGSSYVEVAMYDSATITIINALKIYTAFNDKKNIAANLNNLGNVYYYQNEFEKGIYYHKQSAQKEVELGNRQGNAYSLINIAIMFDDWGKQDSAIHYLREGEKILLDIKDTFGLGYCYNSLGLIFEREEDFNQAINYYKKGLNMFYATDDYKGTSGSYLTISDVYRKITDYKSSLYYLVLADSMVNNYINTLPRFKMLYTSYYEYYKATSNFEKALEYHEKVMSISDSLNNAEKNERILNVEAQYQNELKEREIQVQKLSLSQKDLELKNKNILTVFIAVGLVLVVIFLVIIFNRLKITSQQKIVIQEAHEKLEQKNREITSSITYAERIQNALLKSEKPPLQHFIMLKPKDIVSGDFYWTLIKSDYLYVAVVDCTGHGVPGAFLTMLGTSNLNEINSTSHLLSPSEILDNLRKKIVTELSQTEGETTDGMDISLIKINIHKGDCEWAGANNPLWIVKKDGTFEELKPDKQTIGYSHNMKPFNNHHFKLEKGDSVYLFTDGYADQFGGNFDKKYTYKRLKELILSSQNETLKAQEKILTESFEKWKDTKEQTDDVCLAAIKI